MSAGEADSYIGPDLVVQGKLLGKGSVRIEGRLEGEIALDGVVTLGAAGRIKGPIEADAVSVAGEIEGRVEAKTLIEVHVGGCIFGSARAPEVTVDEGGQITGRIEQTSSAEQQAGESPKPLRDRSVKKTPRPAAAGRLLGKVKARVRSPRRARQQ